MVNLPVNQQAGAAGMAAPAILLVIIVRYYHILLPKTKIQESYCQNDINSV